MTATTNTYEDLYSKFLQAKERLAEYSESITGGLTSLNSKNIMIFNVISSWITYLSRYIAPSTYVAAKNPVYATMNVELDTSVLTSEDVKQAKNSNLRYLYIYIKDKNNLLVPLAKLDLLIKAGKKNYLTFRNHSQILTEIIYRINTDTFAGKDYRLHASSEDGINLSLSGNSTGDTYNNKSIQLSNNPYVKYTTTKFSGGVSQSGYTVSYSQKQIERFNRLLDIISIKLKFVYIPATKYLNTNLVKSSTFSRKLQQEDKSSLLLEDGFALEL